MGIVIGDSTIKYNPRVLEILNRDNEYWKFTNTETLIKKAADINAEAFRAKGPWHDTKEKKYVRNASHTSKNPYAVMLICGQSEKGEWIGISHVIPVTRDAYDTYALGSTLDTKDNYFPARFVCSKNECPYALLVFTIAIDRRKLKKILSCGGIDSLHSRKYIFLSSLYHIDQLMKYHDLDKTKLLVQAGCSEHYMKTLIEGFGFSPLLNSDGKPVKAADGYQLVHASIERSMAG